MWKFKTPGIPDDEFERAEEVPITKEEVRVIQISKARLKPGQIVYDIGCGSGSISIEAAFQIESSGKVLAVDNDENAIELTKKNTEKFGLTNMKIMVPFCRTVEEGKKVLKILADNGLKRGVKGLEIYVMCEIPSNVILADEFCKIFDGFSIGTNDLTQLALGVDRDSELVAHVYDERNMAVKTLVEQVIKIAHAHKPRRKVGICGQAPSDFPEFAQFLVRAGIDTISLIPDTVIPTSIKILQEEKKKRK